MLWAIPCDRCGLGNDPPPVIASEVTLQATVQHASLNSDNISCPVPQKAAAHFGLPKDVTVMGNVLLWVILEKGCEVPTSELTLYREPNRAITVPT
jgi:hypothetical protein